MASKPTRLTVLGVLGVGNLLHIIGLSTPKWVTADLSIPYLWQVQTTRGLFELCTNDNCVTIAVKPDWLKACQAMAILGMLFGLGAGALAFIMYMGLTNIDFKSLGLLCLLAAVVSFILIIICVILFAVKLKDSSWNFGYSFGLSITGAIVLLLGGGAAYGATH